MGYREFQPAPDLRAHVDIIWLFSADDEDVHRITPDGRCELVVHLGRPYQELEDGDRRDQPLCLFAGQLTKPLHLQAQGATTTLSARIAPAAAGVLLHQEASSATDRRIPLADIDTEAGRLPAMLRPPLPDAERVERFSAFLRGRIRTSPLSLDDRIVQAACVLEREDRPRIVTVANDLGLSPRQLERLFRRHVGVSASAYSSLVRFRRIFDLLVESPMSLAEAAAAAGYSDQPQMAREFQRFLGCPATTFLRERAHLAAAMTRGREGRGHLGGP